MAAEVIDLFKRRKTIIQRAKKALTDEEFDELKIHMLAQVYDLDHATTVEGMREVVDKMSDDLAGWTSG